MISKRLSAPARRTARRHHIHCRMAHGLRQEIHALEHKLQTICERTAK